MGDTNSNQGPTKIITLDNLETYTDYVERKGIDITYAEYQELPESEKLNKTFYVTDYDPSDSADAIDISYDNTDSGLSSDNVQDAIDELNDIVDDLPTSDTTYTLEAGTGDDANKIVLTPSEGSAQKVTVPYATSAGDSATVNGKTVGINVPANAVFTDTTYENATTSTDGLMSSSDKAKLDGVAEGATANIGTVTQVKVGTTGYDPTNGIVSLPAYPTSLPASDVTDTYSSSGTAPVSGKAVNAAIGTLDVSAVGGSGKYLTTISETNGKISATAATADTTVTSGSSNLVTSGAVYTAIDNLPEPMVFKGSLGTGGTITALPTNGTASIGDTYKVITAGTYASQSAKVGDTFICDSKTSSANTWVLIPSGDEPSGTVTSVTIKATSPIAVSSTSAITTSGTRTISHETSGATAGSYGDSGNQTPGYGSTFKVPYVTVNDTGHVTGISAHTVKIPASDNTTYTFADGTNQFTVTPSGGSAQTVKVTPSFTVATGDANGQVKINGKNADVKGLGSAAYTASTAYVASTNGTHTGELKLYREGTTDNNYPTRLTFSNKNTTTGNTSGGYIDVYNGGANGSNMVIKSGGNLFVGSGESATGHFNAGFAQSTGETLYIDSDNQIHLQANAGTIANRVGAQIDTSGNIIPEKADVATNNIGGIGTSTYKWANGYFTNINGVAVGTPKFTDAAVYQSGTTTANWRKILLGGQNDATSGTAVTNQTTQSYVSPSLEFQPSTGTLKATKFSGDISGGTGLTKSQVTTALGYTPPTNSNVSTSAAGLAPKVTDTSKYLKGDGTWSTPTNTTYSNVSTSAAGLAPKVTSTSAFLKGDGTWATPTNTTYSNVSTSAAGLAPKITDTSKFLKGDGTWATPTNTTYSNVSSASAGLAPKGAAVSSQSQTTKFLREDGSWAAPSYTTNTDTKVKVTNNVPDSGTWYYPTWYTATSGTGGVNANDGFRYYSLNGTTAATGNSIISLGNATASETAGNKEGKLRLYGQTAYYGQIQFAASKPTANRTFTLPDKGGTFALDSDISTLQTNFQAGVDSVYDAIVARGTTPASKSLSDVVTAIGKLYTPSGTKSITANGTVDIKSYASVSVNVPNPSTGTLSVTANGTYNVTSKASVSVNVPNPSTGTLDITSNGTYNVTSKASATVNVPASAVTSGTYTFPVGDDGSTKDVTSYKKANAKNVYNYGTTTGWNDCIDGQYWQSGGVGTASGTNYKLTVANNWTYIVTFTRYGTTNLPTVTTSATSSLITISNIINDATCRTYKVKCTNAGTATFTFASSVSYVVSVVGLYGTNTK